MSAVQAIRVFSLQSGRFVNPPTEPKVLFAVRLANCRLSPDLLLVKQRRTSHLLHQGLDFPMPYINSGNLLSRE